MPLSIIEIYLIFKLFIVFKSCSPCEEIDTKEEKYRDDQERIGMHDTSMYMIGDEKRKYETAKSEHNI